MLFNSQALARGWANARKMVGDTWHHAVRIGTSLDQGMQLGKRILASVSPIFDQLGQGHHMKSIVGGIRAYDQGKADVMHGYNNVQSHLARIRRQVPELQL